MAAGGESDSASNVDERASTALTATAQPPTFRYGIDVVLVDLTVLEKNDAPVPDLRPDDAEEFRVDGAPRPTFGR